MVSLLPQDTCEGEVRKVSLDYICNWLAKCPAGTFKVHTCAAASADWMEGHLTSILRPWWC